MPVKGGRPLACTGDRQKASGTHQLQAEGNRHTRVTGGRAPSCDSDRQKFTSMCWKQVAGHWSMLVRGGRPRCKPATGIRTPAHSDNRRQAAGTHW